MFTWREEYPRRRNNFSLGLLAEISVRVVLKQNDTTPFLCGLYVPYARNCLANGAVNIMLGSSYPSARKILGTSTTFCNWKCSKNIWRHMIRLLGFSWCLRSSSLRVNSHLRKTVNHRLKHVQRFYQSKRDSYYLIYGITCSSEINFIVNFHLKSSNLRFVQHFFCRALHSHRY